MPSTSRARRLPYLVRIIRAHPRLAGAIVLALAVTAVLPSHWRFPTRLLIGWDSGVALYLVLVYTLMIRSNVEHIRVHAARTDEGRFAILILTVFAALASHGGKKGGLNFPDEEAPDYWDFVYFAFVIGMTSQVSDVAVASKLIRRTVNAHGVVSFFFNTALLALSVNLAASAI